MPSVSAYFPLLSYCKFNEIASVTFKMKLSICTYVGLHLAENVYLVIILAGSNTKMLQLLSQRICDVF